MLLFLYALLFGAQVFLGDTVSNIEYKECTCISGRLDTVKTKLSVPESFEHYNITPEYLPVAPNDYLEVTIIYFLSLINLIQVFCFLLKCLKFNLTYKPILFF